MQSRRNLWTLHNLALTYGQRPSAVLGVEDEWAAYQVDVATLTLGRWVEARLAERDKKGRPIYSLAQLMAEPGAPRSAGDFQDRSAWRQLMRQARR